MQNIISKLTFDVDEVEMNLKNIRQSCTFRNFHNVRKFNTTRDFSLSILSAVHNLHRPVKFRLLCSKLNTSVAESRDEPRIDSDFQQFLNNTIMPYAMLLLTKNQITSQLPRDYYYPELSQMNTTRNYANCYFIAVDRTCALACFYKSNDYLSLIIYFSLPFTAVAPLHNQ